VIRTANIQALLAAGKTTAQVVAKLGCTKAQVYNARWAANHGPRAKYVRPRPRHDLACELLAQGLTYEQIGQRMGVSARTAQDYTSGVRVGRPKGAVDANVERPRCSCGLSLFTPEELASGHCNDCLPLSAVAYMGRRDEPIAHATGDHYA
jgi:DNA-binding CsgD family transcriptional regulator